MRVVATDLLADLESYYDAAPRAGATTEQVGPFTLFVASGPAGWPYYARPRLRLAADVTANDVRAVRARQRELDVPESIEWVHQTTPSLLAAARETGMAVRECPLLVLPAGWSPSDRAGTPAAGAGSCRIAVLPADSPDLVAVVSAVSAGFAGTDDVQPREPRRQPRLMREGLLAVVGAYDGRGAVVGGGTHSPRGSTTELTGIAVLPRARRRGVGAAITLALVGDARRRGMHTIFLSAQDDSVARVYERVGFVRVGTACIAGDG